MSQSFANDIVKAADTLSHYMVDAREWPNLLHQENGMIQKEGLCYRGRYDFDLHLVLAWTRDRFGFVKTRTVSLSSKRIFMVVGAACAGFSTATIFET